jgi:hypothetical protein
VADAGSTNKPLEALFATVYTLTRNGAMDTSLRIAALRIVLEFLQARPQLMRTCAVPMHGWC